MGTSSIEGHDMGATDKLPSSFLRSPVGMHTTPLLRRIRGGKTAVPTWSLRKLALRCSAVAERPALPRRTAGTRWA